MDFKGNILRSVNHWDLRRAFCRSGSKFYINYKLIIGTPVKGNAEPGLKPPKPGIQINAGRPAQKRR